MDSQGNLQVLRRPSGRVGRNGTADDENRPAGAGIPLPPSRWKTRVLVPGTVLVLAAGILAYAARGALRPAVPVRIVPAVVKAGVQSSGTAVVQAPGWVEPDPFPITVSALADGVVSEVLALEGQPVKKGQVVARLVPDEAQLALRRAEAELAERQAELATFQALLTEAQRTWDTLIDLRRKLAIAEAGLAEKQADLARWPAELEAEKARLAQADFELQRLKKLAVGPIISEKEFVDASQVRAAQVAVVKSTEGRKPVLEAQIRGFQAEVEAARQALELKIPENRAVAEARARVTQAEAAVARATAARDEARLRLERMEVRSPVDGEVMARLVMPGSKLMLGGTEMASAQVLRLYSPDKLQVRVDVPLGDAAHVQIGQEAEVVVHVLPDRTFKGRVTRMVHEADIQKNTLQVKVAIEKPAPEIKPEMLARVKFLAMASTQPSGGQGSIFAPARLVIQEGGHGRVWLVDQNRNVAESRHVMAGSARTGDWIEIREGLRAGDWLIADPPPDLRNGAAVRVIGEVQSTGGGAEHASH